MASNSGGLRRRGQGPGEEEDVSVNNDSSASDQGDYDTWDQILLQVSYWEVWINNKHILFTHL